MKNSPLSEKAITRN